MNTRSLAWAAAWLVLASGAVAWAEDGKQKVRLAWPPGDYEMTTVGQSEGTTTVGDAKSGTKDSTTLVWRLGVGQSVGKDDKKVTMRLVEAKTEGEEGGRPPYRYDTSSTGAKEDDRAFIYKPLLAAEAAITLDADDTVVEVSGLDKVWAGLSDKARTDAQKALLAEAKLSLGDKFLEINFRRLEALMPKSAVAAGETWKAGVRLDLPMLGELKARYDCKLASIEKGGDGVVAVIEVASSYSLTNAKTIKTDAATFTINKLDMEEKATLRVNLKTGLLISDDSTRTVAIQGKASDGGKEQEVAVKSTSHTKTTFGPAGKATPKATGGDTSPSDKPTTAPGAGAGDPKPNKRDKPTTVVLRRQWEPKQKAFTVLVPDGWRIEGGLFSIDPTAGGGTLNAIESKCDLSIKRDEAGTVMCRWGPAYNYADFSKAPEFANLAALFPVGRVYNGAQVKGLLTPEEYLVEGFKLVRPKAAGAKISERHELPELVEILAAMAKDLNAKAAPLGKAPMTFTAGSVVFDYTEGGTRFREAAATAICDWRATSALWSNQFTFHMRAPADEADEWKPVLDIIRQSLQVNPEWLKEYQQKVGERGAKAAEVFRTLARLDQEIFDRRSKARSAIQNENYLMLTGQEEYVNPYTKEVERDTSDYKSRWTSLNGDRIYSNQPDYDPNKDQGLNRTEWKLTPVHKR